MVDIEAWKEILSGVVMPNLPMAQGKVLIPILFKSLPSHEEEGKVRRFLKLIEKEAESIVKTTKGEDLHPRMWILSEEEDDRFVLACVRDPGAAVVVDEEVFVPETLDPEVLVQESEVVKVEESAAEDLQPGVYETGKIEE